MANIQEQENYFKERKTVEEIFLEYKPYSLRDSLIAINAVTEEAPKDDLDDEVFSIDLKDKETGFDISTEIEESLDNS